MLEHYQLHSVVGEVRAYGVEHRRRDEGLGRMSNAKSGGHSGAAPTRRAAWPADGRPDDRCLW